MRALQATSFIDLPLPARLARATAAAIIAALVVAQVTFASAGILVPAVEPGGSGGGDQTISDMLRGDYSPIEVTAETGTTEVETAMTVEAMLRGDYSPIDSGSEIVVTQTLTVAEQLRGDLSPINLDTV